MKSYLYLIFLMYSLRCNGEENDFQKQGSDITNVYPKNSDRYRENDNFDNRFYYEEQYEYVGNPDFDAKIERPCRVFDLNCIRKYFAEHSKCKIRRGPLPRSLFISQKSGYFSASNLTTTSNNERISNFRTARIEEFYVNRRTNNLVISINVRGYTNTLPSIYFRFFRKGREPIVDVSDVTVFFPSLTFTTIIPNINDLQLDKSEVTAYIDANPTTIPGPLLVAGTDPTAAQSLAEFATDKTTVSQELMLTESQFFPPAYIQYNICDFELKVAPVDSRDDVFTIQG